MPLMVENLQIYFQLEKKIQQGQYFYKEEL